MHSPARSVVCRGRLLSFYFLGMCNMFIIMKPIKIGYKVRSRVFKMQFYKRWASNGGSSKCPAALWRLSNGEQLRCFTKTSRMCLTAVSASSGACCGRSIASRMSHQAVLMFDINYRFEQRPSPFVVFLFICTFFTSIHKCMYISVKPHTF